jgi:NAD(P)H-nitrite reductase large subunit
MRPVRRALPAGPAAVSADKGRVLSGRYVIVGSGPAAIKACEGIRSLDTLGEITIVGREPEGYYSRPGLAYYLADEVAEAGLFPMDRLDFARMGVTYVHGTVEQLRPSDGEIVLGDGRTIGYDRLLLATGSRAIVPAVDGVELDGVVKLDDLQDARAIIARSRQAKSAVVVGGGITALEIVEGLVARKVKVHYCMRKDRYWSNVLAEAESRLVEERLRRCGVTLHYYTELGRVVGRGGEVTAVETVAGETIPCQMVGLAIGVSPIKALAEAGGLQCARGVLTDEYLRSSDPAIFAAGDLAETRDPGTGRGTLEVLWSSALEKGWVAGVNMAAAPADGPGVLAYRKSISLNVTRLAGYRVTIMGRVGSGEDADVKGVVRGDSETWSRLGDATTVVADSKDRHVRLVLGEDSIVGAVVMGDQEVSFALQGLIGHQVPLGPARDRLLEPRAPLAPLAEEAWQGFRRSHVH